MQSTVASSSTLNVEYFHPGFSKRDVTEIRPSSTPVAINKCALSFILGPPSPPELQLRAAAHPAPTVSPLKRKRAKSTTTSRAVRATIAVSSPHIALIKTSTDSNAISRPSKKGSKLCVIDGCMSRAKHAKRCWRHGGSVKCKVADCDNRAKSKGVCWSHGGGTLCSFDKCDTISVSNGFCWAHGGGKRCLRADCSKPACARTANYCPAHFNEMGHQEA